MRDRETESETERESESQRERDYFPCSANVIIETTSPLKLRNIYVQHPVVVLSLL